MISPTVLILMFGVLIIAFGAIILRWIVHQYRRKLGISPAEREKTSDTSFIINAFQEVTKQLKEKEKELERLRTLAEQRAENIESYNDNILQCVTSGVIAFDRECRLTTINRAAEEMLGLPRDQAVGKTCRDLFQDSEITKTVHETIEKKAPSSRQEAVLERPGDNLWLGYNTAVLTDRQEAALGVILSFSDLTEVKRLQEQVELRERLTALGEMSAGIAHELRNPMAVISGYLNLLSKKSDPVGLETIQSITNEINGMNRIIGDLLTFARPASINRVKLNIQELIENCLATVLQTYGTASPVRTDLQLDAIEVSLDEVLMRQAFTNMIQNALEAMAGDGTLTLKAVQARNEMRVTVGDTGEGIAPEALKKIFLPFFTTKDRGVGMGLALTHKIILAHGGRVEVKSRREKGTTFMVILPLR
jgi:two-component system sensor histidine kinase AtoS